MSAGDVVVMATVSVQRRGACGWIVLNRPGKRNAINQTMLEDIAEAVHVLGADPDVRVLGLRGNGPAFCAGYDVSTGYMSGARDRNTTDDRRNLAQRMDRMMALWDSSKPVIAAIHGPCLGGGMQLASFCDLVAVTPDARIGMPRLPIGAGYASPLLANLIGVRRAKELALVKGGWMDAQTAQDWGWANWIVDGDQLVAHVEDMAAKIGRTPASLVELEKIALNRVQERSGFREAVRALADLDALAHGDPEVNALVKEIREQGLAEVIKRFP